MSKNNGQHVDKQKIKPSAVNENVKLSETVPSPAVRPPGKVLGRHVHGSQGVRPKPVTVEQTIVDRLREVMSLSNEISDNGVIDEAVERLSRGL